MNLNQIETEAKRLARITGHSWLWNGRFQVDLPEWCRRDWFSLYIGRQITDDEIAWCINGLTGRVGINERYRETIYFQKESDRLLFKMAHRGKIFSTSK